MDSAPVDLDLELVPMSLDVSASLALCRDAIVAAYSRSGPAADAEPRIASVSERIRMGELTEGRMCRRAGRPIGAVLWEHGHPAGITVQILYLVPGEDRPATYDAFLRKITEEVGPAVFAPGGLVGLTLGEEEQLMRARGFAQFSRSEMRWPPAREPPSAHTIEGVEVRSVRSDDEATIARLHQAAFGGTFDQYMYLSDPDPAADSARQVGDMMAGRFGEFLG